MQILTSSEPLRAFARQGNSFLWHLAWVPTYRVGQEVALLSGELNQSSYPNSFYQLSAGQESRQPFGEIRSYTEGAPFLIGRDSLTHATVMHFWGMPERVVELVSSFVTHPLPLSDPQEVTTRGIHYFNSLKAFLSREGETIDGCWVDVERDKALINVQDSVSRRLNSFGLNVVTPVGTDWNPHLTLAAQYETFGPTQLVAPKKTIEEGPKLGRFVLGLSGSNGQFRMILARFDEFEAAKRNPNLQRNIFTRVKMIADFA